MNSIEQREETRGKHGKRVELARNHRKQVEGELSKICDEVVTLLYSHRLKIASRDEYKVFYLEIKGDYDLCQAELSLDNGKGRRE